MLPPDLTQSGVMTNRVDVLWLECFAQSWYVLVGDVTQRVEYFVALSDMFLLAK